jgi:hypothetical protein
MQSLSVKNAWASCFLLLGVAGCIAPQQAVQMQFVDAETNLPLKQVEITQLSTPRSSVLPDVPVYGFAGRKAGPPQITHQVADEQWRSTLPGNAQLLLAKKGYQSIRVEPKVYGLRIENTETQEVSDELLLEPTTVIKFSKNPNSPSVVSHDADSKGER